MQDKTENNRIRALIVDDEPLARSSILTLLRKDPQIEIAGEANSGKEALHLISQSRPDLVFLDVQMPGCDGFDVLEMLGARVPPAIVFVTAHDKYALKAFEAGALDYLLKPFTNARFARSLERAKERIALGSQTARLERIAVKNAGKVMFLNSSDIDWIEAADYYVSLHVGASTHLLRRSMNDLEEDLDPIAFCRIHRSTIVNLSRVQELSLGADGEYEIVLRDGTRLRLSRRYRKELLGTKLAQKIADDSTNNGAY